MQEQVIMSLIQIEEKASKLEQEGNKKIKELQEEYKNEMRRLEKDELTKAEKKGENIVKKAEKDALQYRNQIDKNTEQELQNMKEKFAEIKEEIINDFFDKIVNISLEGNVNE